MRKVELQRMVGLLRTVADQDFKRTNTCTKIFCQKKLKLQTVISIHYHHHVYHQHKYVSAQHPGHRLTV